MDTLIRGCEKRHIGCGGLVRFVENTCMTPYERSISYVEWLLECTECGEKLCEEEVEFIGGDEDVIL